jgi:hypothetical protein
MAIGGKAEFLGQHREVHEVVHLALLPARVVGVRVGVAGVQPGTVGVHELQCAGLVAERAHGPDLPRAPRSPGGTSQIPFLLV